MGSKCSVSAGATGPARADSGLPAGTADGLEFTGQTDWVDCAEEDAELELELDDGPLTTVEAEAFALDVLARAGWCGDAVPVFVFDVAADDWRAGWCDGSAIHLHSQLARRWVVLHELAHWLRPMDGHEPELCGVLVGLVRAGLGEEAADRLLDAYRYFDSEVDLTWAAA